MAIKIHKGYFKPHEKDKMKLDDFIEDTPICQRYRKRTKASLTKSEMLEVLHAVLVEHKKVNIVAREYRIGFSTVTSLISKSRKNPEFIAELFSHPNM